MMTRRDVLALPLASLLPGAIDPQVAWALDDADPTKFFTGDKKPSDARLGPPKNLNGYFPFAVPKSKEAWEARRKLVRERVLVANGLWPLPEKTPLNAVIHGKIERDDYTIEKVFFASTPGHYVSGNLYRPILPKEEMPFPTILSPHGHWNNGRFYEATDAEVDKQIEMKAEQTKEGAKYPLQARCAMLARLGFVVFHYDMVGNADSKAIPHREGFRDVAAELRAQNFMGLQTWNSIRALDFVETLPDVDKKRIGVTGASGGGTQTFILCAVDDRPAAAFPAVMVGTAMQGGCVCENCSGLRVDTGNVELAAMFAPKPLAMSGADDWTKEIMTKGYPELKELYTLLGAGDKVAARAWLEFPHNYAQPSREFMYSWFSTHLTKEKVPVKVKEKPFTPVPPKELSVYDAEHPRPKDELDAPKLREAMAKTSDDQIAKLMPDSFKEFQRVIGTALSAMVTDAMPKEIAVREGPLESKIDGHVMHRAVLGRKDEKDAIPCAGLNATNHDAGVVIWAHPQGKSSLFDKGKVVPAVKALTDAGYAVVSTDYLGVGELAFEKPFPVDKGYAGFTYGYNRPLLANRVHDLLTLVGFGQMMKAKSIAIVGFGEMGPAAILAKALAGDAVAKLAADLNQFRFENIKETADPMMLPGAVKYGGMAAFLALCAPGAALVHNHRGTATGKLVEAAYAAAGAKDKLTRANDKLDDLKVVEWLLK